MFLYILVTGHWLCDLLIQTCLQLRQIGQITAFNFLTSSLYQRVHMCSYEACSTVFSSFCETLKYILMLNNSPIYQIVTPKIIYSWV